MIKMENLRDDIVLVQNALSLLTNPVILIPALSASSP